MTGSHRGRKYDTGHGSGEHLAQVSAAMLLKNAVVTDLPDIIKQPAAMQLEHEIGLNMGY